jgi:hypothetical protein
MKPFLFAIALLFAVACVSQGQEKVPIPPAEKSVEWIDIRVPKFPPLAYQARILGTVAIEVHFKGCELDPASPRVVSGHPMLTAAAMENLKQSTVQCGDFANSTATVYYEFGAYSGFTCERRQTVEVAGNRIRILAAEPCIQ